MQEFTFTEAELKEIQAHVAKYPDPKSAVMPALWIAQNKWGWLPDEALKLVANTLELSYAHVYGVASFYSMYYTKATFKGDERRPDHVFDICTCFTCGEVGGREVYEHTKKVLNCDSIGFSEDGKFFIRHAECLGACDTGPVMQVTNGRYVHKLKPERVEQVIADLRAGKELPYEDVALIDQSTIGK